MHRVYIGIGSNLGGREENCHRAVALLRERGCAVIAESSLYETEPWGVEDQPRFINMAAAIGTALIPRQLLVLLKEIETAVGRTPEKRWGPRIVDLDILLYDDRVVNEEGLTIPHPLMHERRFVLEPLSEIAPDLVHPLFRKTVRELLASAPR